MPRTRTLARLRTFPAIHPAWSRAMRAHVRRVFRKRIRNRTPQQLEEIARHLRGVFSVQAEQAARERAEREKAGPPAPKPRRP